MVLSCKRGANFMVLKSHNPTTRGPKTGLARPDNDLKKVKVRPEGAQDVFKLAQRRPEREQNWLKSRSRVDAVHIFRNQQRVPIRTNL